MKTHIYGGTFRYTDTKGRQVKTLCGRLVPGGGITDRPNTATCGNCRILAVHKATAH